MASRTRFRLADARILRYLLYGAALLLGVGAAATLITESARRGAMLAAGPLVLLATGAGLLARAVDDGYVELREDALRVRLGFLFNADISYEAIAGVEPMPASWFWGLGIRTNFNDTVAVLTAHRGVVELRFNRRLWVPVIPLVFRLPARKLRLSLEEPRDFVAALGLTIGPARDSAVGGPAGGA